MPVLVSEVKHCFLGGTAELMCHLLGTGPRTAVQVLGVKESFYLQSLHVWGPREGVYDYARGIAQAGCPPGGSETWKWGGRSNMDVVHIRTNPVGGEANLCWWDLVREGWWGQGMTPSKRLPFSWTFHRKAREGVSERCRPRWAEG
jgi:hypothetical protein